MAAKKKVYEQMVDVSSIIATEETQSRKHVDTEIVEEYAERMKAGAKFPPLKCTRGGKKLWLTDGFHRLAAAKSLGWKKILVLITEGAHKDAILASCAANAEHGLRRTNEDKRRAVEKALAVMPDWSARQVAEHCGVSNKFVSSLLDPEHYAAKRKEHEEKAAGKASGVLPGNTPEPKKPAPRVDTREAQDEAPDEPVYEEGGDDAPPDDYEPEPEEQAPPAAAPRHAPTIAPASTKDREGAELQPATLATFDVITDRLATIYARLGDAVDTYRALRDDLDALADAGKLRPGFDLSKALGPALRIVTKLDEDATLVKKSIPWARCYACAGEGCVVCGMAGWLNEVTAKNRRAEVEHAQGAGMSTAPIAGAGGR